MDTSKRAGRRDSGRPGVHTITLPLLFPLFPINIYLIGGDLPTLIDTGLNTDTAWEALVSRLAYHGLRVKDISRIILTHGHIDHIGLCGRFLAEGSPVVFIHAGDEQRITNDIEHQVAALEQNAVRFKKMGINPRDVDRLIRSYVSILRRFHVGEFPVTIMSDGEKLDCGGVTLSVLHTPGHTAGSVCLYNEQDDILFSGDHVMEGLSTNPLAEMIPGEGVGLMPYLSSLEKIIDQAPGTILPGHGAVITDPGRHISAIIQKHEKLSRRIERSLDRIPITPVELTGNLLPDITGIDASTVAFEVYCHLVDLAKTGKVVMEESEGKYRFTGK